MRYMMLIYSKEQASRDPKVIERDMERHRVLLEETARKGILMGAEPLASTASATTVRMDEGKAMVTDGPFAETKEQLAGYYILECANLDEAIEWAAKIPTACKGGEGCIEIRPLPGLPATPDLAASGASSARNG